MGGIKYENNGEGEQGPAGWFFFPSIPGRQTKTSIYRISTLQMGKIKL